MAFLSICIPAFNKPEALQSLLDSIFSQNIQSIEVVICEDFSPEREAIRNLVYNYEVAHKDKIKYIENQKNLGYDANLRETIKHANGDYVLLMGNDDLIAPDSFQIIKEKIKRYNPAVLIRSYESYYKDFDNFFQIHRYVKEDLFLQCDANELAWLFFRSVLVSGLVIRRDLAQIEETNAVDGTLYYQNYIIGRIGCFHKVLYVPDVLVYNRLEDAGYFGSSDAEKDGKWIPGERTIESSVYQMGKFFDCAEILESSLQLRFVSYLKRIASNYSFPVLAYHSDKGRKKFLSYMADLRDIGYGGFLFNLYGISLLVIGKSNSQKVITFLKRILGHTIRIK